jgi:hypothetical protein
MPVSLALFWDFTQLHETLLRSLTGGGPTPLPVNQPQPEAVDVACVLAFGDRLGRVVFNRAYADWRMLDSYGRVLAEAPLDLTQLFPNKFGHVGVDRTLTADVITYLNRTDSAEAIVIIGGGSEYRQLRKVVKSKGRELIGIGVRSTTDSFWKDACDHFHFYEDLQCRQLYTGQSVPGGLSMDRARDLLVESLEELSQYYGTQWVQQVRIKPAIIRRSQNFDEGLLGYDAFSHFLRDQTDLIERRHRPGEQEPEYRLLSAPDEPQTSRQRLPDREQLAGYYLRVAGQQGIRMPDPVIMWEGIDVYASFLADGTSFGSFAEIDQECLTLLREDFPNLSMTEVKKVRQVLFKCFLFRPSVDDTIGFHEEVKELADIEDRYFELMLARIADNLNEEVDFGALSIALTGNDEQADRLARLYNSEEE